MGKVLPIPPQRLTCLNLITSSDGGPLKENGPTGSRFSTWSSAGETVREGLGEVALEEACQ